MDNKEYAVDHIIKLDDNEILVRLRSNGRVFDIQFGPEDLHDLAANTTDSQTFKQQYLDALKHSFSDEASDTVEADKVDEAAELSKHQDNFDIATSVSSECFYEEDPLISFVVGSFLTHRIFEAFAPKSSTPRLTTLQDVLHPPLLSFSLRVIDGNLIPINQSPEEKKTIDPPWAAIRRSQHWLEYPAVKAKEIPLAQTSQASRTSQTSQTSQNTNLVIYNNRISWFKPILAGVDKLPYIREIDILFTHSRLNLSVLRFPQLEAIILDDKDGDIGFINGLILSAIYPNRGTLADRVEGPEGQSLSITLRERWYHDIESMIQTLHNNGFIWGDVSPNNIIIDEDENTWIVDFGGGYTEGWIEPEDMETKRGDLEGLKRIKEYLLNMD